MTLDRKLSNLRAGGTNSAVKAKFIAVGFIGLLQILSLAFFASRAAAQGIQYNAGKSDYNLRSSGTVNPSTLALELNIPLGDYPGRAGMNLPVSVNYSSKVWQMEYAGHEGMNPNGAGWATPVYALNSTGGWNISLAPLKIESVDITRTFTSQGLPEQGVPSGSTTYAIYRIHVRFPNGSTGEFRKSDVPVNVGGQNPPSSTGIYYAVDGSGMKLDYNGTTSPSTLYLPDGSKFVQTLNGLYWNTEYVDRHGNKQVYDPQQKQWTDTMGRVVSANFTNALASGYDIGMPTQTVAGDKTYSLPGKGGANLNYVFRWRKLKDAATGESVLTDPTQALHYRANYDMCDGAAFAAVSPSLFTSVVGGYICNFGSDLFNPVVLSEIEMPNGQKYRFKYNIFGEIEIVYHPTGGYEKFYYGQIQAVSYLRNAYALTNRGVTERRMSVDGLTEQYVWQYSAGYTSPSTFSPPYKVNITAPDGTRTERHLHSSNNQQPFDLGNGLDGMAYDERAYASPANGGGLLRRTLNEWAGVQTYTYPYQYPRGAKIINTTEIIKENGSSNSLAKTKNYIYDNYGNATTVTERDYAVIDNGTAESGGINSIAAGNILRSTETEYHQTGAYLGRWMTGLPKIKRVKNAGGQTVAQSEIVYDEPAYLESATVTTASGWENPNTSVRGLPTTAKSWTDVAANQYIETHAQYDQFGNVKKSWDGRGNASEIEYSATYQYAYPTKTKSAIPDPTSQHGSNQLFETTSVYDFNTGLPTSATDANGQVSSIEYNDALLRPTRFIAPNGHQTIPEYGAGVSQTTRFVKTKTQIDGAKWDETISWYDGIGRTYKTEKIDSQGNIFVEKEFDAEGRIKRVTNPFRSGEIKQWTTNVYDEASRVREVVLPDGAKVITDYGISASGVIGVTKTITDQAGKKRKGMTDALGRMTRVIEDPTGQNLTTDYVFDATGNLRKTMQGEQSRYFMYDGLGRLLYAKQPEQEANQAFVATDSVTNNSQWSVKYEYDNNGNITKTTDARGVYVAGNYDNLNRLTFRNYSDATPDVNFYYDGTGLGNTPDFSKGKMTKVASSVSETRYTSFDNLGRLLTHSQITDGQTYSTAYGYDLSGALIEETYPSGRVVRNVLNNDGELSIVQSRKNANAGFFNYAKNFTYTATGAVEKMQLGNGRWETAQFNNRLQVTQIGLGATDQTQNLLKLEYAYGAATENNGSLKEQKITVPTVGTSQGFTATQTYAYDNLNRLQSAMETVGTQTWKQTFQYDRYGNRRFDAPNTTTLGSCAQAVCNPLINTSDNRFSSGQGYNYDLNGNVTQDAEGKTFAYDAENHQTEVRNSQNQVIGTYLYDGEGKRVKKISASETTIFVYNGGGQLVAEYSTQTVQTPQVSYLTTDHLGSPRVITDANGNVTKRQDYAAFGDETFTSQRTSGLGYTTQDDIRQGYTGYQKDDESGLDFAQARYYNSQHGRFTSVDPLTASATIRDPQTFNRYTYALNSPYKFTDPLGLISSTATTFNRIPCGGAASADMCIGTNLGSQETAQTAGDPPDEPEPPLPPPPPQDENNVNVSSNPDVYYDVDGENAADAMRNADASKANSLCKQGFAGCTVYEVTDSLGSPGWSAPKKVKGGYEVTENPFNPVINLETTVYLPRWTGYNSASEAEQKAWDKSIEKLKRHESGHVKINVEEANKTGKLLKAALPSSRTFFSKSDKKAFIQSAITKRYQNASKVVSDGYNRMRTANNQYDLDTNHGQK